MSYKQRVGGPIVRTLYKLYTILGYNAVYYSLYLVVTYYFLFAKNVRIALRNYYENLGLEFNNKVLFKHLMTYAITTSDRFISKSHPETYSFVNDSRKSLLEELKKGSIVTTCHFGGWGVASNYFHADEVTLHIVMNEAMIKSASSFEQVIDKKNKDSVNIIDLSEGTLATSIKIANSLLNNESVAFMIDRLVDEKYTISGEFFSKEAYFNKNPFLIAYKTKKPIKAVFIKYNTKREYELVYFDINMETNLSQNEAIKKALDDYISKLTEILKQNPEQWFNFYDFWNLEESLKLRQ
jgi:predicted LPLAT superfamily acyltransferase